jgi:hypothetical protein
MVSAFIAGLLFVKFSEPPARAAINDPGEIDGLIAFYDARALSGLSDGANVATWPDSSGLGDRDAAQDEPAYQPTYRANGLGTGIASVEFGGAAAGQFLRIPGGSPGLGHDLGEADQASFFAVIQQVAPGDDNGAILGADRQGLMFTNEGEPVGSNPPYPSFLLRINQSAVAGANSSAGSSPLNTPFLYEAIWDGAAVEFFVNGADDPLNPVGFVGNGNIGADLQYSIGACDLPDPLTIRYFQGHIAAIVIYDRPLEEPERVMVEEFLSTTYGVPLGAPPGPAWVSMDIQPAEGLVFTSVSNETYRLQAEVPPATNVWVSRALVVHGNGEEITAFDPVGFSPSNTYRLVVLP